MRPKRIYPAAPCEFGVWGWSRPALDEFRHWPALARSRPSQAHRATEGVVLSGALPPGCELATMYTAAITAQSANARQARMSIDLLTSAENRDRRLRAGFVA